MRLLSLISLLAMVAFTSCDVFESVGAGCTAVREHYQWETERFKSDYGIQLPEGYHGGIVGFEGWTFYKSSPDSTVIFQYAYCGPAYCVDFGDTLLSQASVTIMDYQGEETTLLQSSSFCSDSDTEGGIFFYGGEDERLGVYFMKLGDHYQEGVRVTYPKSSQTEVERILKTIRLVEFGG